ncbi:MAG TPA: type II secretion system F family protein [archaeon]|nr:type II secretion system F family protein [archaeon]
MKTFEENFLRILKSIGFEGNLRDFAQGPVAIGAILFIAALYCALFVFENEMAATLSFVLLFAPLVLRYFYHLYLFERKIREIEGQVADLLLLASSLPQRSGIERIVEFMAMCSDGPLNEEFKIAQRKIEAGILIDDAIFSIKNRVPSLSLARAIDMILQSMRSGAQMQDIFRETAQDYMQTNSMLRERSGSLAIEKYTILLAGGLLVPLILGLLFGMVNGLDFSAISQIGIGDSSARVDLLQACALANIIYILEYAAIASIFVATEQSKPAKAFLYALLLIPCGTIVYFVASGLM